MEGSAEYPDVTVEIEKIVCKSVLTQADPSLRAFHNTLKPNWDVAIMFRSDTMEPVPTECVDYLWMLAGITEQQCFSVLPWRQALIRQPSEMSCTVDNIRPSENGAARGRPFL